MAWRQGTRHNRSWTTCGTSPSPLLTTARPAR